jgi:hypothetical protein
VPEMALVPDLHDRKYVRKSKIIRLIRQRRIWFFDLLTMHMSHHLDEVAHVQPLPTLGTFHVMVGPGLCEAVSVLARFRRPQCL